jgi:hypothetical protein
VLLGALLEMARPIMIIGALRTRRSSLLAQPEWSATNFTSGDESGLSDPALVCLLDALAQLSALYSEQDLIISGHGSHSPEMVATSADRPCCASAAQSLLDRSLHLLDDIRSQIAQWGASNTDSEFPSLPCNYIPSSQPCPCTVVTHFSTLHVANVVTFYNAVLILINQFVISMYKLLPVTVLSTVANGSASDQISVAVVDILKSIDYHIPYTQTTAISPEGASGPRNFYLLFPIRIAHRTLSQSKSPQDITQSLWLEDVLNSIVNRAGPWVSNKKIFGARES